VPTYDYQCRSCGHTTEVIHSMMEDGPSTCERCGGQLRRVFYPAGIIFKGAGFYKTDSRSSGSGGSAASATKQGAGDGAAAASGGSSADSSASDSSGSGGSTTTTTPDASKGSVKKESAGT
jgi:putative FmdB family regulatory protein